MKSKKEQQLLCLISEATFAMEDAALFLDTHPCNQEALEYYKEYRKIRKDATKEYNHCFGPLKIDEVLSEHEWVWALQPWPWEGEC